MQQKQTSSRLGTEAMLPLLFKLAVPAIISMFIQAFYNVVDSIFVAKISTSALAALSLAYPIQIFLIAISVGTGIGATSYISRMLGENRTKNADNAAEHALLLALLYGILFFFIGLFFANPLISLFTDDLELITLGSNYIRIILLGSMTMFVPIICQSILRGEGNSLVPMATLIIGALLNILLDPLLIFGFGPIPPFGIEGAAYATVLSRFISGIFILYMLFRNNNQIRLNYKHFKYKPIIVIEIFKVGFPSIIMQIMGAFTIGGLNIIAGKFSTNAIAITGIYYRFESFILMPVFGLAQGYIPILGYNFGYKKPERMKEAIRYSMIVAFIFTSFGLLLFQLIPAKLIGLFDDSPELIAMGAVAFKHISLAYALIGLNIIGSTTFQAIGLGMLSLSVSFIRQLILLLPLAYFLALKFGLDAMWFAFPISETIAFVFLTIILWHTLKKVFKSMMI